MEEKIVQFINKVIKPYGAYILIVILTILLVMPAGNGDIRPMYESSIYNQRAMSAPYDGIDMAMGDEYVGGVEEYKSRSIAPTTIVDQVYAEELDRKVIKSVSMSVEVEDSDISVDSVKSIVEEYQGFLQNMEASEYSQKKKQYTMKLRIPADKYEEVLVKIRKMGYVKYENMSSSDVTGSYYDNEERIKNLQAREEKVREFYKNAKDVKETLAVFAELEDIREQIESLQSQNKVYDDQVDYSTISLTIIPELEINPISEPEWNIAKVWKMAVNDTKEALRGIAEVVVYIVAYAIIWIPLLLIVWLGRWWYRKKRKM